MTTTVLERPEAAEKKSKPTSQGKGGGKGKDGPWVLDTDWQSEPVYYDEHDDWIFLPFFTSNVGRHVTQAKARANIKKVFNQGWMNTPWKGTNSRILGVKGFQEIDEADAAREHDIVETLVRKGQVTPWAEHLVLTDQQRVKGKSLYGFGGFAQATPTAIPQPWTIEDVVVTLTTKGKAKVSPHRVLVETEIRHPLMKNSIWVFNGHYPYKWPEGWSACHEKWQERARFHAEHDHTFVTTRDINEHGRLPRLLAGEKQLIPNGIDRISLYVGDVQAKKAPGQVKVIDTNIDGHDAKGVGILFNAA